MKKFIVSLLFILITNTANAANAANVANVANVANAVKHAQDKPVQAANCITPNSYACCANDNWGSVLWVPGWKLISSVDEEKDVCVKVASDYNGYSGEKDCTHDTPIFNQGDHHIGKDCQIIQYNPT